jgi:UTP--glucose-1-phosphate uridylyltransferase
MKAIIPAAGLGTRFLPATKAVPKELLPVLAKPTIQYVVEEALAAEADEVVIVSNQQKSAIAAHFSSDDALCSVLDAAGKTGYADAVRSAGQLPVSFVEQAEPRGLGHAVYMAADKVLGGSGGAVVGAAAGGADGGGPDGGPAGDPDGDAAPEPFYVLLGDVLVQDNAVLPKMLEISRRHNGASVIAVFTVPKEQVSRFGIIAGERLDTGEWRVSGLVEKPSAEEAPSRLAVFGRYLLSPRVMELLANTKPGAGGEIQLTDALIELLEYEEMYAFVVSPTMGYDVGTVETWLTTNIALAMQDEQLGQAVLKQLSEPIVKRLSTAVTQAVAKNPYR